MNDTISIVWLYIKSSGKLTFNRRHISNLLDINDRQVREAFYKHKDLGMTVIAYPKGCLTIVTSENYNLYRERAMKQIIRDKKIALKKLWRINMQLKALPQEDQMQIDREVLGYGK